MIATFRVFVRTLLLVAAVQFAFAASAWAQTGQTASSPDTKLLEPQPILKGDKVVALFPPGHPALKTLNGYDQPEKFNYSKGADSHVLNITNIHNPSIELQLPPAGKANGTAIIVAAGGGNTTLWVGPEGAEVGKWLNGLGVAAFNLRYRLKPYDSAVDALADTQRAVRMVRAHAKQWGVDPKKIGVMGFSAGGEQAARIALNFDKGKPDAADPVDRESCRPDFVVLVYAGWRQLDLSHVPHDAPPAFCVCAGVGDAFHAKETIDFFNAYFDAKIPAELHIYARGGHGGGISSRGGSPFGAWPSRFVEWTADIGMLPKAEQAGEHK
ncbi:MAG TPA: alpha/beta hydrolase [Pirellulales bacterium]|nr:alpha/beta hydrolase [Pirellulales bacterium]